MCRMGEYCPQETEQCQDLHIIPVSPPDRYDFWSEFEPESFLVEKTIDTKMSQCLPKHLRRRYMLKTLVVPTWL